MACMTSGASSVTLQSLYWRSSDNFSVPAESSRVNWCSPARGLEDEILESRSLAKGRSPSAARRVGINARDEKRSPPGPLRGPTSPFQGEVEQVASPHPDQQAEFSHAIACLATVVAITEHPFRSVVCLARLGRNRLGSRCCSSDHHLVAKVIHGTEILEKCVRRCQARNAQTQEGNAQERPQRKKGEEP